jgi:hypothetical protein
MKLYCDTNIYDFISDKQEAQTVRNFLDANGFEVQASSTNVMETYAISDKELCKQQLKTLSTVATSLEAKPQSWWQAKELLSEIKRVNPHWLRQPASHKLILEEKNFLKGHLSEWERVINLNIPSKFATSAFRKDFKSGVAKSTFSQKTLRQRLLKNELDLRLNFQSKDGKITELSEGKYLEPDLFWRVDCLLIWFEAIVRRAPESRDYADWLLPYVRENAFRAPTYVDFWINRVKPEKLPKNRIASLVGFCQMKQKVTHGNPNDQMHSCHALDVDIFITADKPFFKALEATAAHFTKFAKVILLDRSAASPLDQLKMALL